MNRNRPTEDRPLRPTQPPAHVWIGAIANAIFGALVGFALVARHFWGPDPGWDEWAIIAAFAAVFALLVVRYGQEFWLNLREWW